MRESEGSAVGSVVAGSAQRQLVTEIAVIAKYLECHLAALQGADSTDIVQELQAASENAAALRASAVAANEAPTPLDWLCCEFGLSSFERELLTLCVGAEVDGNIATLCREIQGDRAPTFSLALAALPNGAWGPLNPNAPLRYWHLIECGNGATLSTRRLQIDEYVLSFLLGLECMDVRLHGLFEPVASNAVLLPSQEEHVRQILGIWRHDSERGTISLSGPSLYALRAIAMEVAKHYGQTLHLIDARDLPDTSLEQVNAARLWERHARLANGLLMIEVTDDTHVRKAGAFARRLSFRCLTASTNAVPIGDRQAARINISRPSRAEQLALWLKELEISDDRVYNVLDAVVAQFDFHADDILSVATQMHLEVGNDIKPFQATLWQRCRDQARPQLEHLAQHIDARAHWDDLVLDERQTYLLNEIVSHLRYKAHVYDGWGFSARSSRGLGINALFAGPSGTGKTTAAEVLANELSLDLYRIDLSAVVSKYIGETEKNLGQIFDSAENGGAVLLFDEADALFGKRSDVKDSHDRYANMEVSYLLQRMEAFRGLAILTTNLRDTIDTAFMRRIRFVVEFPFPSQNHRAAIWKRMFPETAPVIGLDFNKLARLNLSGGSIQNVVMNGAFQAANEGGPIQMKHLRQAARAEFAKLERVIPERDLKDWI